MDINSLENNLKAGKLDCMYLLYGDETFLLDSSVKKIKKLFGDMINGINYIQIDNNNISEIIADIQTPAFGYPKKLIIAKLPKEVRKQYQQKITLLTNWQNT